LAFELLISQGILLAQTYEDYELRNNLWIVGEVTSYIAAAQHLCLSTKFI